MLYLNLVKKWSRFLARYSTLGDCTIIYSVATYITDPIMRYVMMSKANLILQAGDYLFNAFHPVYENYAQVSVPTIDTFEPFTGGLDMADFLKPALSKKVVPHTNVNQNIVGKFLKNQRKRD